MKHFQLSLTVKDLHNYKGVPYEWTWIFRELYQRRGDVGNAFPEKKIIENRPRRS